MKSLSNTFLFDLEDKSLEITKKIRAYNPSRDNVPLTMIEDQLNTINKRFNYPLKVKVMSDINNGRVIPVFTTFGPAILPTFIPTLIMSKEGKATCIVNLSKYARKSKDGKYLEIDPRTLFALLQSGTIMLSLFNNWKTITMNQAINKLGSQIFASLTSKVLDKAYAINLNPIKADKASFLLGRFFLVNMLDRPLNQTSFDNAYTCCRNKTTKNIIESFNNDFIQDEKIYKNLDSFVKDGLTMVEGCDSITTRTFLNGFINMYGPSTTMAVEYFPYFCHLVSSVAVGAKLNAEYLIESVCGKLISEFYNELATIIRS